MLAGACLNENVGQHVSMIIATAPKLPLRSWNAIFWLCNVVAASEWERYGMPNGTYSETLPTGGTLKVYGNAWSIDYYIPGPDRRHNGRFFSIPGSKIDEYIFSLRENWDKYEELKKTVPAQGSFYQHCADGMMICIGIFKEGVCLSSFDLPVSTKKQMTDVIESFEYARSRAAVISSVLSST